MTVVNLWLGLRVTCAGSKAGRIRDMLFEASHWSIVYVVVDTGSWWRPMPRLVPITAFAAPDLLLRTVACNLPLVELQQCPPLESQKPVYLHYESASLQGGLTVLSLPREEISSPALRSIREVSRYRVAAPDGRIGRANAFLAAGGVEALTHIALRVRYRGRLRTMQLPVWDISSISYRHRRINVSRSHREAVQEAMRLTRRAS